MRWSVAKGEKSSEREFLQPGIEPAPQPHVTSQIRYLLSRTMYLPKVKPLTLYQTTKFLDWSKLKAFADDKIKLLKMITIVFDSVENIVGKGENVGFQHFLLFPQCFQKVLYSGSLKVGIVW